MPPLSISLSFNLRLSLKPSLSLSNIMSQRNIQHYNQHYTHCRVHIINITCNLLLHVVKCLKSGMNFLEEKDTDIITGKLFDIFILILV